MTAFLSEAEARVEALQQDLERIKELARKEHELLASIVRRLQKIGELADVPNANITGAIHGLINGYVSYRHDYKYEKQRADALAAELATLREGPKTCASCLHLKRVLDITDERRALCMRENLGFDVTDAPGNFGCTLHEPLPSPPGEEDRS